MEWKDTGNANLELQSMDHGNHNSKWQAFGNDGEVLPELVWR